MYVASSLDRSTADSRTSLRILPNKSIALRRSVQLLCGTTLKQTKSHIRERNLASHAMSNRYQPPAQPVQFLTGRSDLCLSIAAAKLTGPFFGSQNLPVIFQNWNCLGREFCAPQVPWLGPQTLARHVAAK